MCGIASKPDALPLAEIDTDYQVISRKKEDSICKPLVEMLRPFAQKLTT